jgi:uncharacterized membrane protein YcaP (DUF421 family)
VFETGTPIWEVVLRTAAVYAVVLAGLRVFGKRQLGQVSIADLVMILLIATAVQNAMVGPDVSLSGGLVAAVTLLALNFVVVRTLARSRLAERLVEGEPTLLIKDGHVQEESLRREGIVADELASAVREHGIEDASGVRVAYLEPDGTISVIPLEVAPLRGRRKVRRTRQLRHR